MNLLALHALNALTDLNSALAPFSARNIVVDLNDPRLNFSLLEFTIHHMLRDGALAVNDVLRKINANHTYNKTLRQLLGRLEILKSDSSENGAILKYYENELRQVQRELLSN